MQIRKKLWHSEFYKIIKNILFYFDIIIKNYIKLCAKLNVNANNFIYKHKNALIEKRKSLK